MSFRIVIGILLAGGLVSCGGLNFGRKNQGIPEVPAHLRANGDESEGTATVVGAGQTVEDAVMGMGGPGARAFGAAGGTGGGFAREQDIVWTDHEDPSAKLPELDKLLSTRKKNTDWGISYVQARREASREGLPLMLWFTNSQSSPRCRALSSEVLADPDFEAWSRTNMRRVRIDAFFDDSQYGLTEKDEVFVKKRDYIDKLKQQYGVHGYPTVVMLGSGGEVLAKYRGYKSGEKDFYAGRLKLAVSQARKAHDEWRGKLEDKGYRTWRNQKGEKVFAKLVSSRKGQVTLVEPDGRRSRTDFTKLSSQDQIWLDAEKLRYEKMRGR